MTPSDFPHRSRSHAARPSIPGRKRHRRRNRFAPGLPPLEARALLRTLVVTNDHGSDPGSLRAELGAAKAGDTITFAHSAYGTITLTGGPLPVAASVDVQGPGPEKVAVSGDGKSDIFEISGGVTATISGLAVADGSAANQSPFGSGGIVNYGTLTLSDVVVTGNSAGHYGVWQRFATRWAIVFTDSSYRLPE
jgi:hypothetical protein